METFPISLPLSNRTKPLIKALNNSNVSTRNSSIPYGKRLTKLVWNLCGLIWAVIFLLTSLVYRVALDLSLSILWTGRKALETICKLTLCPVMQTLLAKIFNLTQLPKLRINWRKGINRRWTFSFSRRFTSTYRSSTGAKPRKHSIRKR